MALDFILFALGLVFLIGGGQALISGASALAASLGVSPLVVGLTAVAFGTSAPELVVSLMAAFKGSTEITLGNVVGSNIANIALLLGIVALIRPLKVESGIIVREIPMMILASASLAALALDSFLGGQVDVITRGDGLMLLLLFGVFLYYTIRDVLFLKKPVDALLEDVFEATPTSAQMSNTVAVLLIAIGVGGLFFGGSLSVNHAISIARGFGISEAVIGATLVAVGTSLPELVTCIQAARKGMTDLVIGNIVGSNIFNILFVLSTTAVVYPVVVPEMAWIDILLSLGVSIYLLRVAITDESVITPRKGLGLLALYVGFIAWQMMR